MKNKILSIFCLLSFVALNSCYASSSSIMDDSDKIGQQPAIFKKEKISYSQNYMVDKADYYSKIYNIDRDELFECYRDGFSNLNIEKAITIKKEIFNLPLKKVLSINKQLSEIQKKDNVLIEWQDLIVFFSK